MTFKNKKTAEPKAPKLPALIAFSVREGKEGGKGFWTRIGAAWAHDDGEGFNIQLEAYPLDGKIVLRTPKADEGESA